MFSYMTHNHSTISIHNHSTLLGLGLENDGKQMISNCLQGKLDRLWMIRGGSTLGLGRIVSGDAGRIDSGADRPVSIGGIHFLYIIQKYSKQVLVHRGACTAK